MSDREVTECIQVLLPLEDGFSAQQTKNVKRLREDMMARYFDAPDLQEEKMLDLEPEEIYYNALRIDGMNNVFECLNEMSQKMEPHEMKELLVVPDLLAFLCDCWMQSRDNSVEEMREYLQKEMIALCEKANGCDLTEGKGK